MQFKTLRRLIYQASTSIPISDGHAQQLADLERHFRHRLRKAMKKGKQRKE